ncbi:MAG: preprotein translocase subunit SecG [Verrucomicrobiota bacterium]|nr:preprotein translocase subunit SecG [Verrucomicrobiota bacterium]
MGTLFISLLTLALLLISAFVVLLVLMQRTSQSGGMGAALGGGAAESAFGSDTSNVLTKGTIYGIISFFLVALVLYLLYQSISEEQLEGASTELLIVPEMEALTVKEELPITANESADLTTVEMTTAEDLLGTMREMNDSAKKEAKTLPASQAAPVEPAVN